MCWLLWPQTTTIRNLARITMSASTRVFVVTSDRYVALLKPFTYLFNTFYSAMQPVVVLGYTPPSFDLPSNFEFVSMGKGDKYPAKKWSDALIDFLNKMDDEVFCLLLEDYFLIRGVDHVGMETLASYMRDRPDILRLDLTNDRLHARGDARDAQLHGHWGHYDIIVTPHGTEYQMSLQAALWNKELMLKVLKHGKSPWEVEVHTSPPEEMLVLGTHQWPLRYCNAMLKGKIVDYELDKIPEPHRSKVVDMIPQDLR